MGSASGKVNAGSWAARGFVAVDWGSTARRAYALDPAGAIIDQMEDERGTLSIAQADFAGEARALRQRFGDAPLLMAGMVGSNRGWIETPYVACPATISDVGARLLWAEPGEVAIVPGLSLIEGDHADVMRGEEVQMFGLRALGVTDDHVTVCHPGTHTKWVALQGGAITRFRTIMTGELFSLLKAHSILADLLGGTAAAGPAFAEGVARGFAGEVIGAELFGLRAGVLLGTVNAADAPSRISGLLIGSDLRSGLAGMPLYTEILVVGRGSLTMLFAAAIVQCGYKAREIDGASAFVAGMRTLAGQIA